MQAFEIAIWTLPALLGLWLARIQPREGRFSWYFIGAVCAGFAFDKAFDLHAFLHGIGKSFVNWLDPETHFRGSKLILRALLLGGLFVAGLAIGWALLRLDRQPSRWKLLSLLGLVTVMAYLGLRLMPRIGEFFEETPSGLLLESFAWSLVITGEILSIREARKPAS